MRACATCCVYIRRVYASVYVYVCVLVVHVYVYVYAHGYLCVCVLVAHVYVCVHAARVDVYISYVNSSPFVYTFNI
jgi:hypothetical protein